jgi:hypothetical protein
MVSLQTTNQSILWKTSDSKNLGISKKDRFGEDIRQYKY